MTNDDKTIRIVRTFDAPRELVFRQWTESQHIAMWFAPDGYSCTRCEVDARVGGKWRVDYAKDADGTAHTESGEFRELNAPERLVLTLTQRDARGNSGTETLVTVVLKAVGAKTEMTFVQTGFEQSDRRDGNAEGWKECFDKLDRQLGATREVRELFEAWWDGCEKKDLDAATKPIARDAVSYEHEAPLQVRGVDAIRAVCKRGFDAAPGKFRWDIPDLEIVVRGDIAVAWGLNRMRFTAPGQPTVESWSRGTRVFQKIDGAWKMIHQHVSFPYDIETGQVKTDLAP